KSSGASWSPAWPVTSSLAVPRAGPFLAQRPDQGVIHSAQAPAHAAPVGVDAARCSASSRSRTGGCRSAMELKQNLQLRLSQQLVMTPQLQQAIRLLQLSRLELVDEIRKELDNNPVLVEDDPSERNRVRQDANSATSTAETRDRSG